MSKRKIILDFTAYTLYIVSVLRSCNMKILIACEYSGTVRDAFIRAGHDAMSCDLLPTESPGPHYEGSVFDIIDEGWDMMIAHPPCTHLAVSGAKWFPEKRADGRQREAIELFMRMYSADIPLVAVENPVGIISGEYIPKHFPDLAEKYGLPIKSSQIIQPWQFGDSYQKTTCLWLKGLPLLQHTKIVDKGEFYIGPDGRKMAQWYNLPPSPERAKIRSKTFPGIAEAMADQWGGDLDNFTLTFS
jgi:hypothetical protein